MTSYNEWALLLEHAALVGPEAVSLVERVGRKRAEPLFWELSRRFADGTARDFYEITPARNTSFLVLERELRRVVEVQPLKTNRLKFKAEES